MTKKIVSIILLIIGISAGIIFLFLNNGVYTIPKIILKVIPTLMMCIWLIMMIMDKSNWMIFVGLVFSMLCDIFMVFDGNIFLVAGILANILALIFYIIYFIHSDKSLDIVRVVPFVIVMGVIYYILFDYLGELKIPVLVYCIIYIVFMWRSAARLGDPGISETSQYVCFIGSTLITVSDALLSALLFNVLPQGSKYGNMVMILWWSGLFLLMITAEIKRKGNLTSIFDE